MQDRHGGPYYKLYDRHHVGDDVEEYCPPGGHMHLYPGEKAMTFECPRELTYWTTDPQTRKKERRGDQSWSYCSCCADLS